MTAQLDNRVNAKIALSSKEDSIAMKTLAFITALFLPGTFIASLFSSNMFDWQASSDGSERPTVSHYFWIYWVVAAPLTILVLIGWVWWYKRADTEYRRVLHPNAGYALQNVYDGSNDKVEDVEITQPLPWQVERQTVKQRSPNSLLVQQRRNVYLG